MRVLERENRKAPNQHRTFSSCRRKRATPPLPHSLCAVSTSTPKPRAENRVPRGECVPVARKLRADRSGAETKSFCPCQKSQVSLLRYLTFSLVSGKIWQQGLPAGPPAVRVVGACSPVGCVQARPRRQPRPSPSAPATKPAKTLGFCRFPFFMCCIAIWCILVRISGFPTRPHPSPAPETHPVSPFLAQIGCVFLFFAVFWPQNFCLGFCATCHIVFTS